MVCVEGARRSQDAVVSGTLVVDVDSEDCPGRAGATDESGGLAECGDEACGKGRRADGKEQAGVPREEGRRCRPKRGTGGRREELKVELVWKARGNRPAARTEGTRAGRCGGEKERERVEGGGKETDRENLDNDGDDDENDDDSDNDIANDSNNVNPKYNDHVDRDYNNDNDNDDDGDDHVDNSATVKGVTVKEGRHTRQKASSGKTATARPQGRAGGRRKRGGETKGNEDDIESDEEEEEEDEEDETKEEEGEEGEKEEDEEEQEDREQVQEEEGGEEEEEAIQQSMGISEYELKRLERIKKNQAFMATLGLDSARPVAPLSATASAHGGGASKSRKRKSKPLSRARERAPAVPVRRSARARGAEAVDYSEVRHDMGREEGRWMGGGGLFMWS